MGIIRRRSRTLLLLLVCAIWFPHDMSVHADGGEGSREIVPNGLRASDWRSIRDEYERRRWAVVAMPLHPGEWRARTHTQHWTVRFTRRGFMVEPDSGGWTWGLELKSYGVVGRERNVGEAARVRTDGSRVTYTRNKGLDEWFVNDARGLEHGFTVHRPPAGEDGPLALTLRVTGGLRPRLQGTGGVVFVNAADASVVTYAGLHVYDADRRTLPARFETVAAGEIRLVVDEEAARYPLTIDPVAQQAYLKASNTGAGDQFGFSVAVSGDTAVIGAVGETSAATGVDGNQFDNSKSAAGAAYVFVRNGGVWTQQAYLKASNTDGPDLFGYSVDVSNDTIVVGAPWEASGSSGIDGDQTDNSAEKAGAAYVFVRNGSTWSQQAYLKASNAQAGDEFGRGVAISGETVVVGAPQERSSATGVNGNQLDNSAFQAGAAYVFVRSGGVWSQQAYVKASNTGNGDQFGTGVDISGDTFAAGAVSESSSATGVNGNQSNNSASSSGAAYVFVRAGGVWSQQAYIKASNTGNGDLFGERLAVSGDTLVVGARDEDSNATGINGNQSDNSAFSSGAAYIFGRSGGVWSQQAYLKGSNTVGGDRFGVSIDVSGDTAVVGAVGQASFAGAAYVFTGSEGVWIEVGYLKASNAEADDAFGTSVTVSDDMVIVGAYGESSNAVGADGDQSNDFASGSGAAYVFTTVEPDIDPPLIDCGEADGLWHASNITIACTAEDLQSGLADPADATFVLTTSVADEDEWANAFTGSRQVCDVAGNCATAGPIGGNMIDRRAPSILIDVPPVGSTLTVNQAVAADYGCTDNGSGVAACAGSVANGAPINTAAIGVQSFSVTASDTAGNAATSQVSYTVGYGVCVLFDQDRAHKSGSTIPIRLQLCDADGLNVSSAALIPTATGVHLVSTNAPGVLEDSGNANPDNAFRYSAGLGETGGYIFNLSLAGFQQGTYAMTFTAGSDPSIHTVQFQVK